MLISFSGTEGGLNTWGAEESVLLGGYWAIDRVMTSTLGSRSIWWRPSVSLALRISYLPLEILHRLPVKVVWYPSLAS
jgi:hypothetical protein